jgi:hypothetical protein
MLQRSTVWTIDIGWIGHQPSSRNVSEVDALLWYISRYTVNAELSKHENEMARMRARMTEGASRLSVGDGLVELLR